MTRSVTRFQARSGVSDRLARPLRDLRMSVLDRCNYRCPYCMPAEVYGEGHAWMPRAEWLTPGEFKRLASLFLELGVTKLRITGGEPLLRRDVGDIVAGLAELDGVDDLALTTNGTRLVERAAELKRAGLKRVTVSLDSVDDAVFRRMNGNRGGVADVLAGVDAALRAGFAPIKVNAVVQRGVNDDHVLELVEHFRGTGVIVRFIEYMDVGTLNGWRAEQVVPSKELHDAIHARWPLEPLEQNYRGEVAERYAFADGRGEIGFISSVTAPFCGDCHRARLAADGQLYTCLFAAAGTDLRTPLRAGATDADLIGLLQNIWRNRADRYSERRSEQAAAERKRDVPHGRVVQRAAGGFSAACRRLRDRNGMLTHIDEQGRPTMVGVGDKAVTERTAEARAVVVFPSDVAPSTGETLTTKKGPVFDTAIVAGVMAVKRTAELIPFCHPIPLEDCRITIDWRAPGELEILCRVAATHKTGVEMEALTGATAAALTVYDMCKALTHGIRISDVALVSKTGGRRDYRESA